VRLKHVDRHGEPPGCGLSFNTKKVRLKGHDTVAFHLLGPDLAHLFPRKLFRSTQPSNERHYVTVFVRGAKFENFEIFTVRRVSPTNDGLEIETDRGTFQAHLADGESLPERLDFRYAIATTSTRLILS